jgi:hypothetical protein
MRKPQTTTPLLRKPGPRKFTGGSDRFAMFNKARDNPSIFFAASIMLNESSLSALGRPQPQGAVPKGLGVRLGFPRPLQRKLEA